MKIAALVFASLVLCPFAVAAPAKKTAPSYHLTKTVALGAPDRWDYVVFDAPSERVFVAHGDRVSVINARSGKVIGAIEGVPGGTHGTAIVTALGRGYTDDGKNGVVVEFDLKTLKTLATIKAEPDADGIVFDAASKHLFVINGDSAKVTVIDPSTRAVVATIDGGGGLEAATADDKGKLFVDGAAKNEVVRIDTASNIADAHWPLASCKNPRGIALDRTARRLFVTCANSVMEILNADTGASVASFPIGALTDGAGFNSKHQRAFSSNGDGTLSVIEEKSPDVFVAATPVATTRGARTMAVDSKSGRVFLMTGDYTINEKADPSDLRHRYTVTPGSARLLFFDPR